MMKPTLAAIVLGGVLLAGCGGGTTEVTRTVTPTMPTVSASQEVSGEPVTSASPSASPSGGPATTSTKPSQSTTPSQSAAPSQSTVPTKAPVPAGVSTPATLPPPATPLPPSEAPTKAPVGGAWVGMDVTVTTAAEAAKLTRTSADFRAFVAERVTTPDASGCRSEFTVQAFNPDGFAAGQDFAPGCGGSQNIWGKVGGTWETIMAMQSVVECNEMKVNNIPKGLPDIPCLDANGDLADW